MFTEAKVPKNEYKLFLPTTMNTENIKETTVFDGAVVGKRKDLEITKKKNLYFKLTAWYSSSQVWINKVAVEMMTRCKY